MKREPQSDSIACLAWGSLVWDPRDLPVQRAWHTDGPLVKVEYLRQSRDNRLTLVLHKNSLAVRGLWALMTSQNLAAAKAGLATREGVSVGNIDRDIGSWSAGAADPNEIPGLSAWAAGIGVQHVVWTALRPKFNGVNGVAPTKEEAIAFWSRLTGKERELAETYVRRTPRQVDTSYRREAEAKLGWTVKE